MIACNSNLRGLLFSSVAWCGLCAGQSLFGQRTDEIYRSKESETLDKGKATGPAGIDPTKMVEHETPPGSPVKTPGKSPENTPVTKPNNPVNPTAVTAPKVVDDRPAFLGVHYEVSRTEIQGAYVTEVEPNTPAATVGLRLGDIITKAEGQPLDELEDLVRVVSAKHVGDKVTLTINRAGKIFTVSPVLAPRTKELVTYQYGSSDGFVPLPDGKTVWVLEPVDPSTPFLGLTFRREERIYSMNGEDVLKVPKTKELVVTDITPGSTAQSMGMQKGDILTMMNGRAVSDFNMIPEMLQRMAIGDEVRITYLRGGRPYTAVGRLKGNPALSGNGSNKLIGGAEPQPSVANKTFEKVFETDISVPPAKPVTIVETTVHPTEVVTVRKASGYDFPGNSTLNVIDFRVTPQAAPGQYAVQFGLKSKGNTFIYVLDRGGNFVYSESLLAYSGTYSKVFSLPVDERGDYFIEISQNGQSFTRKITLQ